MSLESIPVMDIDQPAFQTDPDTVLGRQRAQGWIARSRRGIEIFNYEKCSYVLRDPQWIPGIGEITERLRGDGPRMPGNNMVTSEGDIHAALRMAVQPWFTPHRVKDLRDKTHALVTQLLGAVKDRGSCEFHREVANHLPPTVFCWMVGAPEKHAPDIAAWGEAAIKLFNNCPEDVPAANAALKSLGAFVLDLIATKRKTPGDDLVSVLLKGVKANLISEPDVISLVNEMLGASSDNVSNSASILVWLMCRYPDQWQRLKADRSLIPGAIEEAWRHTPRVRCVMHVNPEEVTLDGFTFPPRTHFYPHIVSAHHDPNVYENPERFDVGRRLPKPQLVFGIGRHQCLGAALARMELQVVLEVLLDSWQDVSLNGKPVFNIREDMAVEHMPIAFRTI